MVKVDKDVLSKGRTEMMEHIMLSSKKFPWYFARHNLYHENQKHHNSDDFMFTHIFFNDGVINSEYFNLVEPIVEYIKEQYDDISIIRIKANLYTNQHINFEYSEHTDQEWLGETDCLIGIFNIISCDGGTVVDGKTYPSVSNQLLLFDNVPHYGITQTDTQTRICINFNFKRAVE